jgi:putative PIN family toxin of toxin-antitoxin system
MMRCVLDTNIFISGIFWGGVPRAVLDAGRAKRFTALSSAALWSELAESLADEKFAQRFNTLGILPEALLTDLQTMLTFVMPFDLPAEIARDPKDVMVLACALGGEAHCIVTGDKDLLVLHPFRGVPILPPAAFLVQLDE